MSTKKKTGLAAKKPAKKAAVKKTKRNTIKKTSADKKAKGEQLRTTASKARMLEALESQMGVVTPALQIADVSRTRYYKWLKDDPDFKAATRVAKDVALDFAESKLHQNIKKGNVAAQIFYLKTQGKSRGYIERTEFGGVDFSKLTTDQLERYIGGEDLLSVLGGERNADAAD